MKTNTAVTESLMLMMLLTPFVYMGLIWGLLPNTIPGHYGSDGHPDRYDPKGELAIIFGAMTLFLYVLLRLTPRLDPRANLDTVVYQKIRWTVMIFWAAFMGWFWTISWRGILPETIQTSTLVGVSLLIMCLGNLINSVKPNYFVGIRTPWTLDNETVWRKTHHLGSRTMAAGGLLGILLTLIIPFPYATWLVVGVIMLSAGIPIIYSYIYFRQEKARQLT